MEFETSQRMNQFRTGIFSELAELKKQKQDEGADVIDLSIGSPDLPPPPFVIDALAENARDGSQYGYTLAGTEAFHDAVASYYQRRFGVSLNPETEVLQLMGSQDGLVHLPLVFANPGDTILVPDPGYTAYEAAINTAGARGYPMPLHRENQFLPDLSEIPEDVAQKAKMMILNFPGNPVPALAGRGFFEEVVRFAKTYEILVVHDFAYCELVFDGRRPVSFLDIDGAKDVGVEFNSLSKSFNMAGCRVAYAAGHAHVIEMLGRLKSNLDYGVFSPVQKAAVAALQNGDRFLAENARVYEKRRKVFVEGVHTGGWDIDLPPATMFAWAAVPGGRMSEEFARELIEGAGVVVTPGSAFGPQGEGYVRIAFVQPEDRLKLAAHRISKHISFCETARR